MVMEFGRDINTIRDCQDSGTAGKRRDVVPGTKTIILLTTLDAGEKITGWVNACR